MTEDKANILLVDDHPENLLALEAVLAELGQNLLKANSSTEALRYALKKDFAVIILDVQMPGMDGFETAALVRARERSKHTPIIFLTAIGTSEPEVFRGYSIGAVDYLFKPFIPEVLRSKVTVFVDLFQMRERVRQQARQFRAMNQKLEQEISERTRAETELKGHSIQLQALNKELESFSYSVSHDLQAPLRHIDGFAGLLRNHASAGLDEKAQRYLTMILDSAKHMKTLIDDLLSFSRMARTEMHKTGVSLHELVKEVVRELEPDTDKRQITWIIHTLPQVHGDTAMLHQVLLNLIANAVKYTRHCENPTIEIGCDASPDQVVIFVRDNGAGFDMQYVDRLFGVFQRLHTSAEFEGTGVGLANVRRIIARHGGKVWAEGAVRQGATFYFSLPKRYEDMT
ncbi:MAG: sensor histidine kinase [Nitrospiraceae bacterium]